MGFLVRTRRPSEAVAHAQMRMRSGWCSIRPGRPDAPKAFSTVTTRSHALICQLREHWLIERGDKFLVPSPIAHIGGSIYAFECPLLLGTTAVLMDRWDADDAVSSWMRKRARIWPARHPFLEQLLAAARRAATRLSRLKVFVCGGASVPPSLIRSAAAYFERAVVTRVYGSTEVPVTTVGVTQRDDVRARGRHRRPRRASPRSSWLITTPPPRAKARSCPRPADADRLSASRG